MTGATHLIPLHVENCTFLRYLFILCKKVKWSRYRLGVAQRVGRGIALLFHDRGTRTGWVVSSTPRPHFTPGKDTVPILQKAGWAPGPVWTGGKSHPHRDSIPDRPARSQSLYWLSYPAHFYFMCLFIFKNKWSIVLDSNMCNWTTLPSSVMYVCIYFFNHVFTLSRKDVFNISLSAVSSDRMVNCVVNCGLSESEMSSPTLRYYLLIHKETSAQVIS